MTGKCNCTDCVMKDEVLLLKKKVKLLKESVLASINMLFHQEAKFKTSLQHFERYDRSLSRLVKEKIIKKF